MKIKLFFMLALIFFFGCANQEPKRMTPQEQEKAKKEIREVVDQIIQKLEKRDADALFQLYSNSFNFILLTTYATIADYKEAKIENAEWFKKLSSLKVSPIRDEFRFLSDKTVVCAWQGKFEMALMSGEQLKIDKFGITFIFSKIDDRWMVIYQHSSSLPPVKQQS